MHPATSYRTVFSLLAMLCAASFLLGCDKPTQLEQVQNDGVLRVITRNSPTTYFLDKEQPAGFEYELAKRFSEELNVELEVHSSDKLADIFQELRRPDYKNPINFAAAGLSITPERNRMVSFSPSYSNVNLHLIYNRKNIRPADLSEVSKGELILIENSSHDERMRQIFADQEPFWQTRNQLEGIDLLKLVHDNQLDYTIIDSNTWALNHIYYEDARIAFDIKPGEQLAWAFPKGIDDSLTQRAKMFFERITTDGTLDRLRERYYGHIGQLNYVGAKTFLTQVIKRLPNYRHSFIEAADVHEVDWRLLAAIGYQESHWRPTAKSPTGVRGMMMLTQITAKEMKVSNRLDPTQSINGGAGYFKKIKKRIPKRIVEPDRTWMALAAYNVGLGHLEDARIITQKRGGNPDHWIDVKESLPLLTKKRWYKQTKYGYARGHEPVVYVQNIRRYYDFLQFLEQPQAEEQQVAKNQQMLGINEEEFPEG